MSSQLTDGAACLSLLNHGGMPKHPKRPKGTQNPTEDTLDRWADEGGAPSGGRAKPPEEQGKDPAAAPLGRKGGAARTKSRKPLRSSDR